MATATRKHSIVNPARRHHAKRRKNKARAKHRRRNLSKAQIRAGFGGKRRKAAMKTNRKRHAKRHNTKRSVARKRHNAPRRHRAAKSHRRVARRRASKRRTNPGEILSLTLGNPGGKRRGMAARRKKHHRVHHRKNRVHHRRRNPGRRVMHHRRHHRNPGAAGIMGLVTQGVFAAGGLVLSRFATQAVLGASNVGFMGYAGNAIATGLLAWGTHMVSKNPRNRDAVILGGVMGIIARLITDFTPYGSFLQQQGFGDYGMGLYLQQNDPMPSRLVSPSGAIVEIPSPGWAPTVVAPSAGMGALYGDDGGGGLYS